MPTGPTPSTGSRGREEIERNDAAMLIEMLKSKIHRAHVTDSNIHYTGSLTIDG